MTVFQPNISATISPDGECINVNSGVWAYFQHLIMVDKVRPFWSGDCNQVWVDGLLRISEPGAPWRRSDRLLTGRIVGKRGKP